MVEKVDVTTLPSTIRPKRVKSKKTFGDYGYVARELDEKKALLDPPQGAPQVSIDVLEAQKSGIYVCVNSQSAGESHDRFQRVLLLKLKNGLLKESSNTFTIFPTAIETALRHFLSRTCPQRSADARRQNALFSRSTG